MLVKSFSINPVVSLLQVFALVESVGDRGGRLLHEDALHDSLVESRVEFLLHHALQLKVAVHLPHDQRDGGQLEDVQTRLEPILQPVVYHLNLEAVPRLINNKQIKS